MTPALQTPLLLASVLLAGCAWITPADPAEDTAAQISDCADSSATLWYPDEDGDGYGTDAGLISACEQPAGTSALGGDCDDSSAEISPGAEELCATAGVDDDCDGDVDEDSAADASVWFTDSDGDGFGDSETAQSACAQPDGTLSQGGDCDDSNAEINPDAVDLCDDVDDNCSGDETDALDAKTWYPDSDGDGFGDADGAFSTCDTPQNGLTDDSDCDDTNSTVNPDAEEVCNNGLDDDCDETANGCGVGESTFILRSAGSSVTPYHLARHLIADLDADGYDDVILGDWWDESEVSVYPGPFEAAISPSRQFSEADSGEAAGLALAVAGDLDNDGVLDLLIGAPGNDDGATDAGAVYLIYGQSTLTDDLSDADMVFTGTESPVYVGYAEPRSVGTSLAGNIDLNGDGLESFAIGAPGAGELNGAVYLLSGAPTGSKDPKDADATWLGEDDYDEAGLALAAAGDIDGDGYDELLIGAPSADRSAGAVYIVGDAAGEYSLADAEGVLQGELTGDRAGSSIAVGDLNDDGVPDVAIGAPTRILSEDDEGVLYVALGPLTGTIALSALSLSHESKGVGDSFADSVAIGDLDADGIDDLVVGTNYEGCYNYVHHSGLYLFRGSAADFSLNSRESIAEGACKG